MISGSCILSLGYIMLNGVYIETEHVKEEVSVIQQIGNEDFRSIIALYSLNLKCSVGWQVETRTSTETNILIKKTLDTQKKKKKKKKKKRS